MGKLIINSSQYLEEDLHPKLLDSGLLFLLLLKINLRKRKSKIVVFLHTGLRNIMIGHRLKRLSKNYSDLNMQNCWLKCRNEKKKIELSKLMVLLLHLLDLTYQIYQNYNIDQLNIYHFPQRNCSCRSDYFSFIISCLWQILVVLKYYISLHKLLLI